MEFYSWHQAEIAVAQGIAGIKLGLMSYPRDVVRKGVAESKKNLGFQR
jgi:hypothetical protein